MKVDQHPVPDQALDGDIAILGRKGKGKSYLARGLVERLLDMGRRVIVLDPLSSWWGLKVGANGWSGYPVAVIGGPHADIALDAEAGELMAQALVDEPLSAVIDLGDLRKGELIRFSTDFLAELYARNRAPIWLVLEEADVFAPQMPMREATRLLHEAEILARRGRARGFRLISITQRPARLHKDVLTQLSTLIALGVTSPHDRGAIEAWIKGNADRQQAREVMNSLASLGVGEGWVWAPEIDVLKRAKFPRIKTLDTSATPKAGDKPADLSSVAIAKADIARLRERIASLALETVEEAEESKSDDHEAEDPAKIVAAEQRGYERGTAELNAKIEEAYRRGYADGRVAAMQEIFRTVEAEYRKSIREANTPAPVERKAPALPKRTTPYDEARLSPAKQRILDAIAWFQELGIAQPERVAVAFIAGTSSQSSAYSNNLGSLRTSGLIEYPGPGLLSLTEAGKAHVGQIELPRTNEALHEQVFEKLAPAQRRIMEALIEIYPEQIDRGTLAAEVHVSASSSAFTNNLGRLRTLGLLDYPAPGYVRVTSIMFPETKKDPA